ncbi:hydrolase [Clostridiisalibacter paucivorans]|uniref:hydrolase n=1 Tax=Clostridiisalibacter paucivorans TaxID=408753 RepID=UPI00047BB7C3|nr:hydrolase [Clostridiisalibacter paucivorans]
MRILKEKSAGIIVDVQERLMPHIYENSTTIKNLKTLIEGLNILEIPLLVSQQYTKGLGGTVKDVSDSIGDFTPMEKMTFSCCDEEYFMKKIKDLEKEFFIIAGIETHVCVLQTSLDLLEKGYKVVLVEDCVSSRRENDKNMAVQRLRAHGAIITTYESLLFELCRYAGTEEFKKISKLVK